MMKSKSVFTKISLGMLTITLVVASISGIISSIEINNGFESFLYQQNKEFGGYGQGRGQTDEIKEQKHKELINEFQSTIFTSILIATLAGSSVAFLIGLIISKQLTNPLNELKEKIEEISSNKYKKIKLKTNTSEINELIKKFNQLIDELDRVEELRENLVSDVSHELKTPLTKIVGLIEGSIDGIYEPSIDHLKKILGNVNQLEHLINQLQKLVQLRSGKQSIEIREVDLHKLINDTISGHSKENIQIFNNVKEKTKIKADKNKLIEVLDNLISNALRHTKKGKVEISFKNDRLIIEDTGEGIPKEHLPYIFERFYRSDKSRNKKSGGLGLGLSIVKEIINLHNWEINVSSITQKGTKFTIITKNS